MFRFYFAVTMHNDVISIAFKRVGWIVTAHPHIEGMVQVQVCQKRADYSSLRSAFYPCSYAAISLFYPCFQPTLCVQQHPLLLRMMRHHLHHPFMTYGIKEPFDV